MEITVVFLLSGFNTEREECHMGEFQHTAATIVFINNAQYSLVAKDSVTFKDSDFKIKIKRFKLLVL